MRHRVTPTLRKAALATTLRLFRRRSRRGETGFSRRPARHDSVRRPARRFRMLSMVVGVRPQAICAQGVRAGPGSPSRLLPPLVREAVRRRWASADPSMAPGGAGYREHHPGHGVLSRTGPDPLPAPSAPLLPPPEIRSAVDRRDGRFGPPAEIWGGPDDPPEAGSPAGFGLQPSAGRCGSLGSSALPRGSTVVRNAYGIPTPMRFSTE
jgi:hypothetical protein